MTQICENCGTEIPREGTAYRLHIELYADPAPPEFTEEDLKRDFDAEMQAIIDQMRDLDPREAQEEVYEDYLFTLCSRCRKKLHNEMRRRHLPFEDDINDHT